MTSFLLSWAIQATNIVEKPKNPTSTLAVTGIYCYPSDVFTIVKDLKPSHRNELEITDVNNAYLRENRLTYSTFKGYWSDAGTFPSLDKANELVRTTPPQF
jgi:glucose-1-phosphate thymidylyltransferase